MEDLEVLRYVGVPLHGTCCITGTRDINLQGVSAYLPTPQPPREGVNPRSVISKTEKIHGNLKAENPTQECKEKCGGRTRRRG